MDIRVKDVLSCFATNMNSHAFVLWKSMFLVADYFIKEIFSQIFCGKVPKISDLLYRGARR